MKDPLTVVTKPHDKRKITCNTIDKDYETRKVAELNVQISTKVTAACTDDEMKQGSHFPCKTVSLACISLFTFYTKCTWITLILYIHFYIDKYIWVEYKEY